MMHLFRWCLFMRLSLAPAGSAGCVSKRILVGCVGVCFLTARVAVQGIVPLPIYFSSEWSFAQFKIPETGVALVGFGPQPHTLVVITKAGSFYRLQFDAINGGPMEQLAYNCFADSEESGPLGNAA